MIKLGQINPQPLRFIRTDHAFDAIPDRNNEGTEG